MHHKKTERSLPMRRARVLCLLVLLVLLGAGAVPAAAQTFLFSVPQALTDVYVNEDGTVSLAYTYVIVNDPSADPMEVIDIGLPTQHYDLSSITATIDGQPVDRIAKSEYIDVGIEVHMGAHSIPPGGQAQLEVYIGTIERMLFRANTKEEEAYASFQFQPNFFGGEFITGKTDMTVTLHLPPGLQETEPRYFEPQNWPGSSEPVSAYDSTDRVFYQWNSPNADITRLYVFGAAFPARLVPASALLIETKPSIFNSEALCPMIFCLGFSGFMIFTIYAAVQGDRKRKLEYFPPRAAVEGNGIKRGLTAVEAALVMNQPMDKILTMVLFSVIKKNAASVVTREPMKLDVVDPQPEGLQAYETQFLQAMKFSKPVEQRRGLQDMMTALVKSTSEKMRGFSRKETIAYYQEIMTKAWQQVEAAQTPELKMKAFDDAMDWTMLDKNFDDHTRDTFGPRPVVVPTWWGHYDPTYHSSAASSGGIKPSTSVPSASGNRPPTGMSVPNVPGADFAASVVGGIQSFASGVVGDVTSFTGGVTQKTNPPPKPPASSGTRSRGGGGGGGGGRSCACACACAGCACACAGGGR